MIVPQATETKHWSFRTDIENIGWLTINSPRRFGEYAEP
jgi:3-hydroxyacyl-CoA dehydrogenase/enoyl-CoA hydratase/3-hydroxybutyryl-CoA epimerase